MANNYTFASGEVNLNAAIQNTYFQPLINLNYCVNSGVQFPLVYSPVPLLPSSFTVVNFGNTVQFLEPTTTNATYSYITNGINVIPEGNLIVESSSNILETVNVETSEKILEPVKHNITPKERTNIKHLIDTGNEQVESSSKTTDNSKVDASNKIPGKILEDTTLSLPPRVFKKDINVTPDENLQGESLIKTSDIYEIGISNDTPGEMLQIKSFSQTFGEVNTKKNSLPKSLHEILNVKYEDVTNIKDVSGTKSVQVESLRKTTEDFKAHNSNKVSERILDPMTSNISPGDIEIDSTMTPTGNLQVESSTRTPKKIIKLKSPKLTFKNMKDLIPEENLQLKKSIKTYERINVKENLQSKSLIETSNVGNVLNSNKKLNHTNNIHENLCAKCGICNESFVSHQMIKTSNYYICFTCNETSKLKTDLLQNTMIHKEKENKCNICHKFFKDSVDVIRHVKSTHDVKNNGKLFLCDVCDEEFVRMYEIASHRKLHFMSSSGTEEDLTVKKIRNHHVCIICWKSYTNKVSLDIHYRVHSGTKPYTCNLCNTKFICDRDFKRHRRIMHPIKNVKYFACNLCPKVFSVRDSFKDHLNDHNGFTPYKCEHCDKKFSHKFRLKYHCWSMHSKKQSYSCKFCSKEFSKQNVLKLHMNRHLNIKPYKCEVCPKTFYTYNLLTRHCRTHTGEKPHVCDVCQKGFSMKNNFLVHYRIHTGEKPFVCEICNKAFRVKVILTEHYKTHKSKKCNSKSVQNFKNIASEYKAF